MTVAIACCAAYVTPVSSPVNMLVMEPGGYAFGDYVKVGLPLLLLTMLVTVALVAVIYPMGAAVGQKKWGGAMMPTKKSQPAWQTIPSRENIATAVHSMRFSISSASLS